MYERAGKKLPKVGDREAVVDSNGDVALITRLAKVKVVSLSEVTLEHAFCEGEGYETVEQWQNAHEKLWTSTDFQNSIGTPAIAINDDTQVVCETIVWNGFCKRIHSL